MRKILVMLFFVFVINSVIFSFELSGSYLMELSGYERTFYGISITLGDKDIMD
ncbi:hypothetical protein [Marinitoga lauensis]|uniref:hypothetical protein n=1 Tax=Marinitoga lauensis TaxID=2201189 RepID=UPI001404EA77|nr:hypothetical protein [Marinitoga lauensis]